jgi:hypothetical protein
VINAGDGVLGDLGVESVREDDFIESEEGVLGRAEKRFRFWRVVLKGLLEVLKGLEDERTSSIGSPGLAFGGGAGAGEREFDLLREPGRA